MPPKPPNSGEPPGGTPSDATETGRRAVEEMIRTTGAWLAGNGPEGDVVISSRARLARNLAGHRFTPRSDPAEKAEIADTLRDALASIRGGEAFHYLDLESLPALDRQILLERHLISREQFEARGRRGLAVDREESLAVMVNEEDHLRLQSLRPGLQLEEVHRQVDRLDDELSETVTLAWDEELGYLTACPTNLGTGLRVSVMLHLPALVLTRHLEKAFRALHELKLAVRGLYGEGTESQGDFYQVSNQITIGRGEEEILEDLRATIEGIVLYERLARERLKGAELTKITDRVWRAWAMLAHARLLTSEEAMKHLSSLRLGLHLGLIDRPGVAVLNEIFLYSLPAHLQRLSGNELPPEERDVARARFVRERIAEAGPVPD